MGKLGKDAKDLLIGVDGSENEPRDFKAELDASIKAGLVTKADGALLVTARINMDELGKKIEQRQLDAIKKIKADEVYENSEQEKAAMKKKKEKEAKKKQQAAELAKQMNEISKTKSEEVKEKQEVKEREN